MGNIGKEPAFDFTQILLKSDIVAQFHLVEQQPYKDKDKSDGGKDVQQNHREAVPQRRLDTNLQTGIFIRSYAVGI